MVVGFARVGAHERLRIRNIGTYGVWVGDRHCGPGDVVECSGSDARELLGRGTFVRHVETAPPVPEEIPEPTSFINLSPPAALVEIESTEKEADDEAVEPAESASEPATRRRRKAL